MNNIENFNVGNECRQGSHSNSQPLVSIVVPAYNEAAIIKENIGIICNYMESLESQYCWELIIVNDGSYDETGDLVKRNGKNGSPGRQPFLQSRALAS